MQAVDLPAGERPRIAVGPDDHYGTSPEEHDRIACEAARAAVLVTDAPDQHADVLERLVRVAPGGELRFPFVATLERFMAEIAQLDDASTAALSDDELLALWCDAGATHRRPGEPWNSV